MTTNPPEPTCEVSVADRGGWNYHRCGRPAKGHLKNGRAACGLHLAGERRREKSDAEFHARRAAERAETARLQAICDEVNREYPALEAHPSAGLIRVQADALREMGGAALGARLRAAGRGDA